MRVMEELQIPILLYGHGYQSDLSAALPVASSVKDPPFTEQAALGLGLGGPTAPMQWDLAKYTMKTPESYASDSPSGRLLHSWRHFLF
jgi:hypothetical protein